MSTIEKNSVTISMNDGWQGVFLHSDEAKEYSEIQHLISENIPINCCIPSNVEIDLFNAGLCKEPFFGMNPVEVNQKTEHLHCYYFKEFTLNEIEGVGKLIFEGIDCYSNIYLNGKLLGSTDNMFIPYSFDVTNLIMSGKNELLVHIYPAVEEALNYEYAPVDFAQNTNYESINVRKAPHMYGWDIMPRFISAGIWRTVKLEFLPKTRIEDCYLYTQNVSHDLKGAVLKLWYDLTLPKTDISGYIIRLEGKCNNSAFKEEWPVLFRSGSREFTVTEPELWWPRGSGEQNLYDCAFSLIKDDIVISEKTFKLGIRSVTLFSRPTATDLPDPDFCFKVNNRYIFIKGTNWVPADALHSRDSKRIPTLLNMAADINCNMLRCWGGNVYEDNLFFDECDRLGIMIWQDFAMACAYYPQTEDFFKRFGYEVKTIVKKLRQHCSIAMWAGDNECDQFHWYTSHPLNPNNNHITRDLIPDIIRREDPVRPYLPSSPYFSNEVINSDASAPELHMWSERDYFKIDYFTNAKCSFISESGFFAVPSPDSLKKFISPEKLWPYGNDEWVLHGTSPVPISHDHEHRIPLTANQITQFFDSSPQNLAELSIMTQIFQAEALKFLLEHWRIKSKKSGLLWWNLADGWPQISDAIVDYYNDKKLAYYFIKNSQQQVLFALDEPNNWKQKLIFINDAAKHITSNFKVTDIESGKVIIQGSCSSNSTCTAAEIDIPHKNHTLYLIEWDGDVTGKNHYLFGHPLFSFEQYWKWIENSHLFDEFIEQTKTWK